MTRYAIPLVSILAWCSILSPPCSWPGTRAQVPEGTTTTAAERVIVRLRPTASAATGDRLRAEVGARLHRRVATVAGLEIWSVADATGTAARLADEEAVAYAEPDRQVRAATDPNDPYYASQWNLRAIHAPRAWERITSTHAVVVAVIDSGIDYTHPDLAANMWRNPGEIPGNGTDDDRNGYVDDVYGWDFANRDRDPMDDNGHGTHVAGIIGAVGDNGIGVAGVAWTCRLMALKFLDSTGRGWTTDAVLALDYAVRQGVLVSNNSWGSYGHSRALSDAIRAAGARSHLFVAAAGNDALNIDSTPFYPAAYPLDNIVAVAASGRSGGLAGFSNYGERAVDLAAPGDGIYSTLPYGSYGYMSGTSMAAPHVAGALALAAVGCSNYVGVIETRVQRLPQLRGLVETGGLLDLSWLDGGRFSRSFVTNLAATSARWSFDTGDWDHDGWVDLIGFRWGTGSSPAQIHVLSGRSGFETSLHASTHGLTNGDWGFHFADWNRDGYLDAVGILKTGTGSGRTEVHISSGATGFQTTLANLATALPETGSHWEFDLADWDRDGIFDLVGIAKNATGSGRTEVHILSGRSSFQTFILHSATEFGPASPDWEFEFADWDRDGSLDLIGLNRQATGSGSTEIHALSGASGFQSWIHRTGTVLPETDFNWQINVADADHGGRLDLFAVHYRNTASGNVELQVVDMPHQPVLYHGWSCGAAGSRPELTVTPALLGSTYDAVVTGAVPGGPAFLARGNGEINFDLGPFGAPGCRLWTQLDQVLATNADGSGRAVVRMPMPPVAAFIGRFFYHQFVIPDLRVSTPAKVAVTRGGRTIVMCR